MEVRKPRLLSLDKLVENKANPKKALGLRYRRGLKGSLEKYGFAGLFIVAPNKDGTFEILDANTRFELLAEEGIKEVPCIVMENLKTAESRRLFALTFDRHRKVFDEDIVIEQLREMVQSNKVEIKQLETLSGIDNLKTLTAELSTRLERETAERATGPREKSELGSLVLYGPSEDIDTIKALLKTVRCRVSAIEQAKLLIEQFEAFGKVTDEAFLGALLKAIAVWSR